MNDMPLSCDRIEPELLSAAMGDADEATAARVDAHVRECRSCRESLDLYRAIGRNAETWREIPARDEGPARERLVSRLADLRRRTLVYRIFRDSPLGPILIARSEEGVTCIEYLTGGADFRHSSLSRVEGVEALPDGAEVETLYHELLEYLGGRRTRLEWTLDLRLARSAFHRAVLEATAEIPYGAVRSYAGLAEAIGKPSATRAVAQALRTNPLAIVVPCHRVVGTSGALTGYAGRRVTLKQRILAVEGVAAVGKGSALRIPRERMYVLAPEQSYCLPSCAWIATAPARSLVLFGSRERAENAGLAPCDDCRPDLHPLP